MNGDEPHIARATERDLEELALFMQGHGNNATSADQLKHWYFNNPSRNSSVMIGRINGAIVGMATTNDHYFNGPEGLALVAMPQKVLTDQAFRGKGIFNKLYWASEKDCRDRRVGFFLTVTNEASTPIFLKRFGYQRLPIPKVLAMMPAMGPISSRKFQTVSPDRYSTNTQDSWSLRKDPQYYQWRFQEKRDPSHIILHVDRNGRYVGDLYMKRIHKRGLPVLLLLDMVPSERKDAMVLLRSARRIAFRHRCVALLALDRPMIREAVAGDLKLEISSGFNLLVKGFDEDHTRSLATQSFELSFGDLDFL